MVEESLDGVFCHFIKTIYPLNGKWLKDKNAAQPGEQAKYKKPVINRFYKKAVKIISLKDDGT